MAKKKTIAKLVDECAVALQLLVRVKAADENGNSNCVTCGAPGHYKEMNGGHFISRKWLATKILEENIHNQCRKCNGPLRGNMIQYTLFMIETYGKDFVEELERLKHVPTKYYKEDILKRTKEFKRLAKEIQEEKGI